MKNKHIYIICLAAGLLAAESCQVRDSFDIPSEDSISISLSGNIDQQNITRAADNAFAAGDQVGIWAVNYDGDTPGTLALKGNQATNVRFTFDGNSTWTPDYDIYYKDKNTKVDLYGIYPYTSAISSIDALPFEVREDQSTVSAHGNMGGYEASDFLWAKRTAVTPTPSAVQLTFQHKMSCVVVTLVEGTGFTSGEFASLSKAVLISNVKRNATINLATGDVTATGSVSARSTVPAAYEGGFRAIVVPQTIASSTPLFSITIGGTPYTYSEATAFTYLAGKQHNFAVTINKKADGGYDVTVNTSISAWTNDNSSHEFTAKEYVVVNVATPGTLGTILTESVTHLDQVRNLKVTGHINANDFFFMRDYLDNLSSINMQNAQIDAVSISYDDYPANAIPHFAFSDIYGNGKKTLTSFIFPLTLELIERGAFYGTSLTGALIIPEGVIEIQNPNLYDGVFKGTKITSISLPQTLQTIGSNAFCDCNSLVGSISFPNNLRYIGEDAFRGCSGLTGPLVLPDNLQSLGPDAFNGCSGLSGDLVFPQKITVVQHGTFYGCQLGGTLILHDGITEIGASAFRECSFKGELVLPQNLSYIGESAFENNLFSSMSPMPETLHTIGQSAFAGNTRLTGIILFPNEMTTISNNIFNVCHNIEGIELPPHIASIGMNAFNECFQLNTIVCHSEEPPVIQSGAFNGVPKDNFAVEVPEASVNQYTYADGWKDFERITAHRDFSISRNLLRVLNASESKTYVLRAEANAEWHVESKPDWVTVTPSSGTGKTNVVVTVNNLAGGADNRSGDVVFLLDGKDYRSSMKVEQYNYSYSDGDVVHLQESSVGNGIPLVFLGDCYDAADIAAGDYLADIQQAIDYFFDIEPYKTYQNYFDVYIVFGKSPDSGVGTVNTIKESKFGTQYSLTGGSLENDGTVAFQYAKIADPSMDLTKALVIMVLNSEDYGGITYMWNDGSAIAICPKSSDPYPYDFRGLVQHEAGGHGFGKLGDEYIYINAFIQACSCGNPHLDQFRAAKANGWYKNLSETSDRDAVPWGHLMYHPAYANTVDIYEGGYFHTRAIFRSEANSCMNNNIPYYSAISRQAIVERIMEYAGIPFNLETFYENDAVALTKASFTPEPIFVPSSSTQTNFKHHHPIILGDHPTL